MFSDRKTSWLVGRKPHVIYIDDENLIDEYCLTVQEFKKRNWKRVKRVLCWKKGTSNKTRKLKVLSRIIMNAKKGQQVRLINGNGLDLRRENLKLIGSAKHILKKKLIKRF
jgi:hypothetical protein